MALGGEVISNCDERYTNSPIARQQSLYAAGVGESRLALETALGEQHELMMAQREEFYVSLSPVNAEIGQQIYERKCSNYHDWEQESFGPPYGRVLTKYRVDQEALKAYLRKPTKMDPAYPAVPNPKLEEPQIESVILYLMAH